MERFYRFAGLDIAIHVPDKWAYADDRPLMAFRVPSVEDAHHFYFQMVQELTPSAGILTADLPALRVFQEGATQVRYIGTASNPYMRVSHQGKAHHVQMLEAESVRGFSSRTVRNALSLEHLAAQAGGFVFHSSYIQWEENGILFTAPSGTGKSTQAELWHTLRNAEIVNGDRSVIRVSEQNVFAEGIPFAGSSQICLNRSMPLKAIVYLTQASETSIRKLQGAEAFHRVWEGVSVNIWDSKDMDAVSSAVEQVVSSVPIYYLACTPDESAVMALEGVL